MKPTSSLLIFIALIICCCSRNQPRIPYNADRVEITANYPDSALYESTLTYLEQEGFVINKNDSKRGAIVTDYKAYPKNVLYSYRLIIGIKEQKILFRGEGGGETFKVRIQNMELNNNVHAIKVQKLGFRMLDEVARRLSRRLPGSTYVYKNGNTAYAKDL